MGRKARDKKDRPRPATSAQAPSGDAGASAHTAAAISDKVARAPLPAAQGRVSVVLPQRAGLWAIGLAVLAGLCYLNALQTPFLLDDPINIAKNPVIQHPLSLPGLLMDQRAVVTASLRINYAAGGLALAPYHLLNVGAHIVAGWMLFALAYVTLRLPVFEGRYARAAEPLAAMVAAVFLLHPVQTESVTYIIQRAEIFVSIGLMGALLGFVGIGVETRRPAVLAFFAGACLLGAYSKPSFAAAPALLLVYDLCFLSRGRLEGLRRRWLGYAIAGAVALWTFALARIAGSFHQHTAGFSIEGVDPWQYVVSQFGVVLTYLRVVLWPDVLCFDCGYRGPWPVINSAMGNGVVVPAAVLGALVVAAVAAWRRYPLATFAVIGSAVVLAPTSLVPLADFYVEHRMYLPIAFLALALVPAAFDATRAAAARMALSAATLSAVRRGLATVLLAVLALLTVARNRVYADPVGLMLGALDQAPQNERVQYNLGNEYKRRGQKDKAIERYQQAIRLAPHVARSYMNLGAIYLDEQRYEDALRIYQAGVENVPGMAMTHRNLAVIYLRLGRYEDALQSAERGLAIEPDNAHGHVLAAQALDQLGRKQQAIAEYEKALSLDPRQGDAAKRLAQLRQQ